MLERLPADTLGRCVSRYRLRPFEREKLHERNRMPGAVRYRVVTHVHRRLFEHGDRYGHR